MGHLNCKHPEKHGKPAKPENATPKPAVKKPAGRPRKAAAVKGSA